MAAIVVITIPTTIITNTKSISQFDFQLNFISLASSNSYLFLQFIYLVLELRMRSFHLNYFGFENFEIFLILDLLNLIEHFSFID